MKSTFPLAGIGIVKRGSADQILEIYFPEIWHSATAEKYLALLDLDPKQSKEIEHFKPTQLKSSESEFLRELKAATVEFIFINLTQDQPVTSIAQAYLKLSAISRQLFKPNQLNLDGLFAVLPTVAWTNQGPIEVNQINQAILKARLNHQHLTVYSVDKFPPLTAHYIPGGVRIADAARVRLGAYLGKGTTVMHEGFVNFNAGTEGPNMVEGRISAGVFLGKGTDLGGGASTMGTLSGGNNIRISLGDDCLIGANSGCGVPLGNNCTIEAGLYLTAGMKVKVMDRAGEEIQTVRARDLAGVSGLLFRRNSETGAVEALPRSTEFSLNEILHLND
ncbi:tetrahydrodipicolinate N-succinyltransferase N-terminal domain-containing protein [bacterium]|nr:tetrahydrodipicolinate N-succinyltransferase N-terminal domain-containing protein [bacterium]